MRELDGQVTWLDLGISFGKMCLEHSVQTEEKTSKQFSQRSSASQSIALPMCLCLRSGQNQDASMMKWEDGALLGEFTMHSFGESPKEENGSRLSQILEDSAPRKYYLSATACAGILRRAEKRGKDLPKELKAALEKQSLG